MPRVHQAAAFFDVGLAFDAGFAFDAGLAFDAGFALEDAGLAAALVVDAGFAFETVLVLVALTAAFLAASFFAGLLADDVFLAGAAFLMAVFLVAVAVFFAGEAFLVVVAVVAFFVVDFAAGLALVAAAGFFAGVVVVDFLTADLLTEVEGLEFSLAAEALAPGESLTFPEGPLGSTK